MTRSEAIKALRTESIELGGSATSVCRFLEALDMAAKALEDVTDKDVGSNEPLALDELRKMDGEPVWVVCDKGFEPITLWALVEVCEESIFLTNNLGGRTEYADDVELEDDGITVYRQKPKEG